MNNNDKVVEGRLNKYLDDLIIDSKTIPGLVGRLVISVSDIFPEISEAQPATTSNQLSSTVDNGPRVPSTSNSPTSTISSFSGNNNNNNKAGGSKKVSKKVSKKRSKKPQRSTKVRSKSHLTKTGTRRNNKLTRKKTGGGKRGKGKGKKEAEALKEAAEAAEKAAAEAEAANEAAQAAVKEVEVKLAAGFNLLDIMEQAIPGEPSVEVMAMKGAFTNGASMEGEAPKLALKDLNELSMKQAIPTEVSGQSRRWALSRADMEEGEVPRVKAFLVEAKHYAELAENYFNQAQAAEVEVSKNLEELLNPPFVRQKTDDDLMEAIGEGKKVTLTAADSAIEFGLVAQIEAAKAVVELEKTERAMKKLKKLERYLGFHKMALAALSTNNVAVEDNSGLKLNEYLGSGSVAESHKILLKHYFGDFLGRLNSEKVVKFKDDLQAGINAQLASTGRRYRVEFGTRSANGTVINFIDGDTSVVGSGPSGIGDLKSGSMFHLSIHSLTAPGQRGDLGLVHLLTDDRHVRSIRREKTKWANHVNLTLKPATFEWRGQRFVRLLVESSHNPSAAVVVNGLNPAVNIPASARIAINQKVTNARGVLAQAQAEAAVRAQAVERARAKKAKARAKGVLAQAEAAVAESQAALTVAEEQQRTRIMEVGVTVARIIREYVERIAPLKINETPRGAGGGPK